MSFIITYYTGQLFCQFRNTGAKKLGNTGTQQSHLLLEPRFRLYDMVEIPESAYPKHDTLLTTPHVLHQIPSKVEFYSGSFNSSDIGSKVYHTQEIILLLEKVTYNGNREELIKDYQSFSTENIDSNDALKAFYTTYGNQLHGKIKGKAFIKVIRKEEHISLWSLDEKPVDNGKIPITDSFNDKATILSDPNTIQSPLINNQGCLSGQNGCLSIGANSAGCLPLQRMGCLSLPRLGCLLPFLFLLPFLLIGAFLLLKDMFANDKKSNHSDKNKQNQNPIVIHDTIKVEIIKERVDTLMFTKSDTLSYLDSTIRTKYETVSLPNVQYYTNSDILLPSSASDLQKLAEYMIKNDTMTATIYGHTDNVGDHESNMELSKRRAESVKRFLTSLGVSGNRLQTVGLGDTKPKADNSTEEGRLMNRRVEVTLENTVQSKTKRRKLNG